MKYSPPVDTPITIIKQTSAAHFIRTCFAGLALCSVSIVTHAIDQVPLSKPSYTIKIIKNTQPAITQPANMQSTPVLKAAEIKAQDVQGTLLNSTNKSLRLSNGGVIWVSSDPISLVPRLSVSTSKSVEIDGNGLTKPLQFILSTNYAAFIDHWTLRVFKASDEDQRKALVTLSGSSIINGQGVSWDGKTTDGEVLTAGNKLTYELTVRDNSGHMDKTHLRTITLSGPGRNIDGNLAQDKNMDSNLRTQTIPLHGARVRIYGNDITDNQHIDIDGEKITVSNAKFVVERLLPEGKHQFTVAIKDQNNSRVERKLSTQVSGKYMFMIGLADVTIGEGKVSGNIEGLGEGDRGLDGDVFVDGRLAFYLKGKIKGKYLITAQMDTGTEDIEDIFDDIHKKDPSSLFRRLDSEKYYPVYGDDSTLTDDTNSQGKMYVRVDWDKSQAVWGNYNTDMTDTELSSFNRSLYGAKLNHQSTQVTNEGQHRTDLTVFASETTNAFAHNQFLGTGGSLYYLKNTDIVDGSEKIWVEVRERGNDRVVEQVVMEAGRDYEIDDFQGRIILRRPLLQIAAQANPSLVKDTPLDGNEVYLMVDYEYVPDGLADKGTYGARGKAWLTDHFAIGGSYAHESRSDHDYDLKGIDITLQKTQGTYLVAEYAETNALQSISSFFSDDGGLQFNSLNTASAVTNINGTAYSIEARANLEDFTSKTGSLGAWYKHRDAGFSIARLAQGEEIIDGGVEAIINVNDALKLSTRISVYDKKQSSKLTSASIQGDYKVSAKLAVSGELRRVQEDDQSGTSNMLDGEGTLGAFKVGYDVNNEVNIYVIGQSTIEKSGNYRSNDLVTVGTIAKLNHKLDMRAELSTGDRGDAGTLGLNYKHSNDHTIYTNYTLSSDTQQTDRNLFTIGQRQGVTNRLKIFTEHQFINETLQDGLGHDVGLDYKYTDDLTFSSSVQTANLKHDNGSNIDRQSFSVGLRYDKGKTTATSRIEYRQDKNDTSTSPVNTEQWVTTNRINYRATPDFRVQGKLNYSETTDQLSNQLDAKFIEVGLGFAYRPINNDRLNALGRLNYLYDLQPLSQSSDTDEKSLLASIELNYQLNQQWMVGGKLAHKMGDIRTDRTTGQWQKNDATLAAARVRYHLTHNWDAMAEYHWLNSEESQDTQHGALVAVDRHVGKNMKVGVGYNFTTFDDDLNNSDGDAEGWFVNLVGKF